MAQASGSLNLDVSKFVSGVETAKNKLLGLRSALEQSSTVAKGAFKVWDSAQQIATGINTLKAQIDNLTGAWQNLKAFSSQVPSAFKAIQSAGQAASRMLAGMSPALRGVALAGAGAGIAIFGAVKAFQLVAGAGKAVVGAVGSIISKMGDLANKAKEAAVSVAKVVGKGIDAGFRGIGNVAKIAGAGILALGTASVGAGAFIAHGVTGIFDMGDELKTLRDRTGASIPFIMDLQKAFKGVGMSGDAVGPMLSTMQRSLTGVNSEGEPTNKMFARLGLKTEELSKMDPGTAFKTIGTKIAGLASPAERTAASLAIFGKAGGGMTAIFADDEFGKIGTNLTGSAQIMADNADTFAKISIALRSSGATFKDFFVQIAGKVGAPLLAIMEAFQGGDFLAGIGEKIGSVLGDGLTIFANAIKEGKVFELFQTGLEGVVMMGADLMARGFSAAVQTIIEMWNNGLLKEGIGGLISGFASATQVMLGYLMKVFQTPIIYFQAGIQTAIEKLLEGLGKIPMLGEKLGLKDFKAGSFSGNKKDIEAQGGLGFGAGGKGADQMIQEGKKGFTDALSTVTNVLGQEGAIFKDKFAKQGEIIDGAGEKWKQLTTLTGTLMTPIEKVKSKANAVAGSIDGGASPEGSALADASSKASKGGNDAVSSLQKIGGGGGVGGGDPMLRNSDRQVKLLEDANKLWQGISEKFTGTTGAFKASPSLLG
jgi:hypothetical protein